MVEREVTLAEQARDVMSREQSAEHVEERDNSNHGRYPAQHVDHAITKQRNDNDAATEDDDAGAVVEVQQLGDSLSRQNGAAGGESYVHYAHRQDRDDGSVDPELDSAGDHLW